MGDEDELVAYMYWFITRRDMTISVLTNNMNPMLANAQRSNWNFQRAPWPWQLADPFAIHDYVLATMPPEPEQIQTGGANPTISLDPVYIEAKPGEIVTFTVNYPRLQGVTDAAFIAFAEDAVFQDLPLYLVDFSGGACGPGHEEYAVDPWDTATVLRPGEPFPLPVSLQMEVSEDTNSGDLLNVCVQLIGYMGDSELFTWNASAIIVVKE